MRNLILGKPMINKIFDMNVEDAHKYLSEHGHTLRIINEDGKSTRIDAMDFNPNRVNVFVENGIIYNIDNIS